MSKFLNVVCLLFLAACVKISDIPEEEAQAKSPQKSVMAQVLPTGPLKLIEGETPNSYSVEIEPEIEILSVRRWEKGLITSVIEIQEKSESGHFIDRNVSPGKVLIYEWIGKDQSRSREEIVIPRDLHIQSEYKLQNDESWDSYRRIFLGPRGVITTQEHSLEIRADQIISDGGTIRTFAPEAHSPNQNGLAGGTLSIVIRTGSGKLYVGQRGQGGADGIPGRENPMGRGLSGGNGFPGGASGNGRLKIIDFYHELQVSILIEGGSGGKGGPGGKGGRLMDVQLPSGSTGLPGASGERQTFCFVHRDQEDCR